MIYKFIGLFLYLIIFIIPGTMFVGEAWHQTKKTTEEFNEIAMDAYKKQLSKLDEDEHWKIRSPKRYDYGLEFAKWLLRDPKYYLGMFLILLPILAYIFPRVF